MEQRRAALWMVIFLQLVIYTSLTSAAEQGTSPQFMEQPSNLTAFGTASLQCSTLGSPQPSVLWFKDDTAVVLTSGVTVDSLGTLEITSLQNNDAGAYHCVASNALGSVRSRTAHLELAFLGTPGSNDIQNVQAVDHEFLILSCNAPVGRPHPPTFTWTATPSQILNDRVGVVRSTGDLVFSFIDDSTDLNLYECNVRNSVIGEEVLIAQYFLMDGGTSMLFHELEFVVMPTPSQVLVAGDTLSLECFTTGRPVADITWLKDDTTFPVGGRVTYSQNGRELIITSTTPTDSGTYTCVASQPAVSTPVEIRASAEVTVVVAPVISTRFPETEATITQPLTLTCGTSQGTTPLQWEWFFNGEPVTMTTGVSYMTSGSQSTLSIASVVEGHEGVYQCVVRQPLTGRTDNANELVTVIRVAPMFTHGMELSDIVVLAGQAVTLPCRADGFPTPTFKWYRANSDTPIAIGCGIGSQGDYCLSDAPGNGSLTISEASVGDSSILTCEATNTEDSVRTDFVTLRVIGVPVITTLPVASLTPPQGTDVILTCSIADNDDYSVQYQWTRESVLISSPTDSGTLTVSAFNVDDNGVYTCVALLDVNGIQVDPVQFEVGSSVITVGAPPTAPSQPFDLRYTSTTSTSFMAHWQTPASNGGLPLRNYSIEVFEIGNNLPCSGDLTWTVALEGIDPSATVAMVTGLHSFFEYRIRVIAFNHQFQTQSVSSAVVQTSQSTPQAPPTIISVTPSEESEALDLSWQEPSLCSSYGGPLIGYTVQYRVQGQMTWDEMSVGGTMTLTIEALQSDTVYEVHVAASTSIGQGVFSDIVTATTREAPLAPPSNFTSTILNQTTVSLTWEATPTATGYVVTYVHPDGRQITVNVMVPGLIVTDLVPNSMYKFRVSSVVNGVPGPVAETQAHLQGPTTDVPIYEEVWFIAVVAVAGVIVISVVMTVCAVFCYKCCCKCGRDNGKIYITSRRSASSMSAGSSGFSEYQHKHNKINAITKSIKVHSSPTPSRRSTDYADMDSLRPAPSVTAPSYTFTDSLRSDHRNGQYPQRAHMTPDGGPNGVHRGSPAGFIDDPNDQIHMYPPDEPDYPLGDDELHGFKREHVPAEQHIRHLSGGVSQPFFDTLNRVHTPPLPSMSQSPEQYSPPERSQSPSRSYHGLSQETSDSWNPMDNLNHRGHMTNNPVSRSNSNRSSQTTASGRGQFSSAASTPQKFDLGAKKRVGPLSPVHEQLMRSGDNHMGHGMSMQDFPPRSNSVHGNMSMSTGHISHLDRRHNSMGAHTRSAVNTHQSRQPPVGMELGTMTPNEIQNRELPPIPFRDLRHSTSPVPNLHSVEYSSIPPVHVSRSQQLTTTQAQPSAHRYPPPTTSPPPPTDNLPPPPHFRHSPENGPVLHYTQPHQPHSRQHSSPPHTTYGMDAGHNRQISSPPLLQQPAGQRSPSPVYSAPQVKPKPNVRRNLQNGFREGQFEQIPMQPLPQRTDIHIMQPHATTVPMLTPVNHYPQPHSENSGSSNGVSRSEESWPLDDLQRQFESDIQDLEALQNMLTPVVTDPQQSFLQDQAQVVAVNDGGPVLPRDTMPGLGHMSRNQSFPAKPLKAPKPSVAPKPHAKSTTDITTSRQTSTSSIEDPNSLAINKQRPNVPHLSQLKQLDPRKPKKLYGKVRGAVWQPRSMNKVIESSSESGSDSDSDFSMADTVVEADTASMKSSHV